MNDENIIYTSFLEMNMKLLKVDLFLNENVFLLIFILIIFSIQLEQ